MLPGRRIFSVRAVGYFMKRNKVLKIIAIVLAAILALLAVAALGVFLYMRHMMSSLPETLPDAADSTVEVTLTDDDLNKLLNGEIDLDDLNTGTDADSAPEEDASASVPQQDADSAASDEASAPGSTSSASDNKNQTGASSSGKGSSSGTVSSSGSSSSSAGTGASSSQGTAAKTEPAYEAEVKALLRQLYAVKARAESELSGCVAGAKAEYWALPESQQTQARKVSIVLSRSSRLYSMQAAYDKEVEGIVSQMRDVLTANGQSTALADQAMASYKAQKSATYSRLMAELYS